MALNSISSSASTIRSRTAEILADEFDRRHAPNEQMGVWHELQTRVMKRCCESQNGRLPACSRSAVCFFISDICTQANSKKEQHTPQAVWLEVMQVFDMTSDLDFAQPSRFFSHAIACWLVCTKIASGNHGKIEIPLKYLVERASHLSMSIDGNVVTSSEVKLAEVRLLTKFGSGIFMQTAQDWLATFWTRFDAATGRRLQSVLASAWCASYKWAVQLVSIEPISCEMSPKISALGICCIIVVAMGLLPAGIFKPQQIDDAVWADNFRFILQASPARVVNQVDPTIPPHVALAALELATDDVFCSLRDGLLKVLEVSQTVLAFSSVPL